MPSKPIPSNRVPQEHPASLGERAGAWAKANYDVLASASVALVVFGVTISRNPIPSMVHDAYAYTMAAQRLVRDGFLAYSNGELPGTQLPMDARVTPGYILFLAAFYAVIGRGLDPIAAAELVQPMVVGVQFILAIAVVALVALSGRELGGRRLGLVAGLMASAYVPFAWASTVALSESLAAPMLAGQAYWTLRLARKDARRGLWELAGYGAFSAAIVMVRPSMVLWVLVPLAYIWIARLESWKRLAMITAAGALGFVLLFAPWWARNYQAIGTFVPLRTDFVRGAQGELKSIATDPPPALSRTQQLQRAALVWTTPWTAPDDVAYENTFHYDKDRVDFGSFPGEIHDQLKPLMKLMRYYQLFLLAAGVVALFFVRRSPRLLLLASVPVYAIGIHAFTQVNPRYAFLGMPALIILAAAGAYGVWRSAERRLRAQ